MTEVADPALQRPAEGAAVNIPPLDDPQTPSIGVAWRVAAQPAVVPPLAPVQLQDQGPFPVTEVADPAPQRPAEGAVVNIPPLDDPQTPSTGVAWRVAAQPAVVPPLTPVQLHDQGPVPVTEVADPAPQRPAEGAVVNIPPLDDPQTPSTGVA